MRPSLAARETGGSVKAEGLGDGGWVNHRQAALDDATRSTTPNENKVPVINTIIPL